jgi:asparagine synthase (glutamine-hydrolysing)
VEKLPYVFDEPFSDPSTIPTLLVSGMAASKVKVAISADGGDENFCGYNRYANYHKRLHAFGDAAAGKVRKKIGKVLAGFAPDAAQPWLSVFSGDLESYLSKVSSHISDANLTRFIKLKNNMTRPLNGMKGVSPDDQLLLWDLNHYLPDNVLVKVDRASMALGLESREPLLDHSLMEYVARIPFDYKFHKGVLKHPVKKIVHRYINSDLIDQPKKGFSPPLENWMTTIFKNEFNDWIAEAHLKNQGIFNSRVLPSLINSIKPDYLRFRFMWSVFIFQKWYQTWIKT